MTTNRVYRQRREIDKVLREIEELAGRQFDPQVVAALVSLLEEDHAAWQQRIDETVKDLGSPTPTPKKGFRKIFLAP